MHCRKRKRKDRPRQRIRLISDGNMELWKREQATLLHQNILLRKGKSRRGSGIRFSSSVLFYIWIVPTFISTAWAKNGMQWSCNETLDTNVIEPQLETKKTSRAAKVNLFQPVCVSVCVSMWVSVCLCVGGGEGGEAGGSYWGGDNSPLAQIAVLCVQSVLQTHSSLFGLPFFSSFTYHKTSFHGRQLFRQFVDSSCGDALGHFLTNHFCHLSVNLFCKILRVYSSSVLSQERRANTRSLRFKMKDGWTLILTCSLELTSKPSCQCFKCFLPFFFFPFPLFLSHTNSAGIKLQPIHSAHCEATQSKNWVCRFLQCHLQPLGR